MARGDIVVRMIGDPSSLKKGLKESEHALDRFSKRADIAGKSTHRLNAAAIAFSGGLVSGAGLVAGVKVAIDAASNLTEQINKSEVVFGKSAKSVLAWSKDTATALGIAQDKAIEYAGTFGNMLKPMGFAQDKAAKMSTTMVKLAADMASFNNASPEATLAALQSGLAGQVRPLRQFGVFLDQARIKQEALALGLYSGKGALDASAKAAASYAIILKDTKDAQGDFARTSGGLANQQRILKAQISDLEAEIGKKLLPVVLKIVTHVNEWTTKLLHSKKAHEDFQVALKDVKVVIDDARKSWKLLADAVGGNTEAIKLLGAAFVAWKLSSRLNAISIAAGGVGGSGAVGRLALLRREMGMLAKIGIITIGIELIMGAHTTKSGLHRYSGKGGWDNLGNDIAGLVGKDWQGKGGPPGSASYPLSTRGNIIGRPYQGTHGKAFNQAGGSDNWESENAVDIAVKVGTPVVAVEDGVIGKQIGSFGGSGRFAGLRLHLIGDSGNEYYYAHLSTIIVQAGERVKKGQPLGMSGSANGVAHLHLASKNGDPSSLLSGSLPGGLSAPAGGDTGGGDTGGSGAGTVDLTGDVKKGGGKKAKVLTGSKLLSTAVQLALAKAGGTKGTADDLSALERAQGELAGMPQTVAVAKELANVEKQIQHIKEANLKAHLAKQAAEWKKHAKEVAASIKAQDAAWKTHIQKLQDGAADAKRIFDRSFGEASGALFKNFDKLTALGLGSLDSQRGELTPAEQALKSLLGGHDQGNRDQGLADAKKAKADAQERLTAAGGGAYSDDPAKVRELADAKSDLAAKERDLAAAVTESAKETLAVAVREGRQKVGDLGSGLAADRAKWLQTQTDDAKQAAADILAAQAQIDQATYDQKVFDLQEQAAAERTARDKEYGDKATAYQEQRDLDRQKLQDWLDDQKLYLDEGKTKWDDFYAELKKKAAEGGWDVGAEFWKAWEDAQNDRGGADRAKNIANNPGAGDRLQTLHEQVLAGTIDRETYLYLTRGRKLDIPGFADGVNNFRGGLALVGERGPEIVSLPGGSSVTPNGAALEVPVQVFLDGEVIFAAVQKHSLRNKKRNGANGLS